MAYLVHGCDIYEELNHINAAYETAGGSLALTSAWEFFRRMFRTDVKACVAFFVLVSSDHHHSVK